jgi:hypothetical protein
VVDGIVDQSTVSDMTHLFTVEGAYN